MFYLNVLPIKQTYKGHPMPFHQITKKMYPNCKSTATNEKQVTEEHVFFLSSTTEFELDSFARNPTLQQLRKCKKVDLMLIAQLFSKCKESQWFLVLLLFVDLLHLSDSVPHSSLFSREPIFHPTDLKNRLLCLINLSTASRFVFCPWLHPVKQHISVH